MPEERIPVRVTFAARARIAFAARLDGISNRERLERLIQDAAMALPPVPKPPHERRPMSEVRAQRRQDLGGVSPYTAAITIIPKEQT